MFDQQPNMHSLPSALIAATFDEHSLQDITRSLSMRLRDGNPVVCALRWKRGWGGDGDGDQGRAEAWGYGGGGEGSWAWWGTAPVLGEPGA
jgi:hypothetical protein